jgi:hypothetical protein
MSRNHRGASTDLLDVGAYPSRREIASKDLTQLMI